MKCPELPMCPSCGLERLEQHRTRKDLLICPTEWIKYDKEKAMQGIFERVIIYKPLPRLRHKRGY